MLDFHISHVYIRNLNFERFFIVYFDDRIVFPTFVTDGKIFKNRLYDQCNKQDKLSVSAF